jgi:hypothetical protein
VLERDLVGDRPQPLAVAPGEPGRDDERAGLRPVELLDEVALAPLAGVDQQAGLGQLPHVVVDALARLAELPGHAGGRRARYRSVTVRATLRAAPGWR